MVRKLRVYKSVKCTLAHNDFFIRHNNLYCKQCGLTVLKGQPETGKKYITWN